MDIFCIVYLDDILVFSSIREEHTAHLHQILSKLQEAQLYINPVKYKFYHSQVEFLGYVINQEEVTIDLSRI